MTAARSLIRTLCWLATLAVLAQPGRLLAANVLELADPSVSHPAGLHLDYFEDRSRACDFACAQARFAGGPVIRSQVAAPNLGIDVSYWFALQLRNTSAYEDWVARLDAPFLDAVDLYVAHADGRYDKVVSGDNLPMSDRPFRNRLIVLPFRAESGDITTLYFRIAHEGALNVPLFIDSPYSFAQHDATQNLLYGFYFGILAAVLLYNLFIFAVIRDISYLYYVGYIAAFAITMGTPTGYGPLFLWPEHPWWINRSDPFFVLASGIFLMLFTRSFLRFPRADWRDKVMLGLLALIVLLIPVGLFAPFGAAIRIIYVVAIAGLAWLLFIGIEQVIRGNRAVRYFLLAWLVLLAMAGMLFLVKFGVLPSTPFTENGILFGSALETILLSTALAHRFALMREEGMRTQAQATLELERRVEERTRELDQALQARSEFLATVSHEIRTPMNGVLGIAELLLDTDLNGRQKEYVQIIHGSGRTLLTIINDILDYSKIEAGKMTLENTPFRIRDVLNNSIQIFRAEAERKKLRFATLIDRDVPEEIVGDPVRLQQVLNNLLSNAIKFTDDGEIRLAVHREDDGKLTFSVQDTGIGIAADIQSKLFEAFNQGDRSMARRFGGTGLGLAISRQLVALMGGSISFESDLGHGTTFYFTIPVEIGGSGAWRRIRGELPPPRSALHVLVIDDNGVNLQVAAGMLRKLGHRVDIAATGKDGLELLFAPGARYDLVFMDCEMPELDGYSATRLIRLREQQENRPHTPVVAMTAHAFEEKIAACREAGMDEHLAKPISLRALEQVLAYVASKKT